jgi:hypothetical protein
MLNAGHTIALMTILPDNVTGFEPVQLCWTVILYEYVPDAVGVPEIRPDELILSPGGRDPELKVYV